jgi:predicted ArsR family transcriptional regulator
MVAVEHIQAKEAPMEQTKVLVMSYLKEHFKKEHQVYPSDVADALGLQYEVVRQVFDELEKEGKIQESR